MTFLEAGRQLGGTALRRALSGVSVALALGAAPQPALAHPFLDERLQALDRRIASEPENAELRVVRGGLLLDEGHAAGALPELERALELDPTRSLARLLQAQALLALSRPDEARLAALRFLELASDSARGWRQLAEIEGARRDVAAARAAFARYFELAAPPRPEDYLARAELERSTGDLAAARAGLEEGVARLGSIVSLLEPALELVRRQEDEVGALPILERLIAASPADARWPIARAETLAGLGRAEEARRALAAARAQLESRTPARRGSPALRDVAQRIAHLETKLSLP